FSLVCLSDEVSANPGDNVVLSCQLEPAISAASMKIKWWHLNNLVCRYENGQLKIERAFVGRVHFPLDLERGKLSLKICEVRKSQRGEYTCEVIHGQQVKKEHIYLHVKSVNFRLVVPNHTVNAYQGEDVTLHVQFFPTISAASLIINWLKERLFIYEYVNGKEIRHRHYEDRVGLNNQELDSGNIFLTLKNVRLSDSGNYTCQVKYEEYVMDKKIELHVRAPSLVEIPLMSDDPLMPDEIPLMHDDRVCKWMDIYSPLAPSLFEIPRMSDDLEREWMDIITPSLDRFYLIDDRELKWIENSIKEHKKKDQVLKSLQQSLEEGSHLLSLQQSLQFLRQSIKSIQHSLQSLQELEYLLDLSLQHSLQSLVQSIQQSRRLSFRQSLELSDLLVLLQAFVQSVQLSIQQSRKRSRLESRLELHIESLQRSLQRSFQQSPQQILPLSPQQIIRLSPQQILPLSPQQIIRLSPQQILPQSTQQITQQILPQSTQQITQQILPQSTQQITQQIFPQSTQQITQQILPQSTQQILPQSTQQILFVCDDDDMDDDRNKNTLFLFDQLTWMEIIHSIMHDADIHTPEGQEVEEETEQR
ncbi:uncharacterized protein LOC120461873, partial [Pimephales promelas]|uniref:uncharacterized protein LOC120461873 n=1 Tax=Pimephales promelas TaxID=90988 RepID=UPI00195594D3